MLELVSKLCSTTYANLTHVIMGLFVVHDLSDGDKSPDAPPPLLLLPDELLLRILGMLPSAKDILAVRATCTQLRALVDENAHVIFGGPTDARYVSKKSVFFYEVFLTWLVLSHASSWAYSCRNT